MSNLEISHLRYFSHVAETGSFVGGARRAHVSAPAMTKAIQRLEEETGARLFERTTRRVALTEEGRALLRRARAILGQIDEISRDLEELKSTVAGELRIAAMEVFSIRVLPRAISALVAQFPKLVPLVYEMHPEAMRRHLADGSIDVGFTIGAAPAEHVHAELLGTSPGRIVCGKPHPLFEAGRISRADLSRHPFVVPRFFGRESLASLDQFPDDKHPRIVGATIELLQMAVELTVAGTYLCHLPELTVAHLLKSRSLRVLKGLGSVPAFELYALTRKSVAPRRGVTLLIGEIQRVLRV